MTEKPFDPAKPCRTRNGRAVRILCTDAKDDFPIVALVDDGVGGELLRSYDRKGMPNTDGLAHALVNLPERLARWTRIFPDLRFSSLSGASREDCGPCGIERAIAYLELITEDGQPVEARLHPGDDEQP
jgi:hypothetical protein